MKNKLVTLHNLGCKVNSYETQAVQQLLENAGYEIVPFPGKADVVIINTCTVTAIADKKSRQMLHRARTLNPDAIVVAMGCYVETGMDKLIKDGSVDLFIGNNRKKDIVAILDEYYAGQTEKTYMKDISRQASYEELELSRIEGHTRAFLKVQDGCDQFCSYCIIPYARGRIRSRSSEEAIEETRRLARSGIKEIVLTGIHLSSYGRDGGADTDLAGLIEKLALVDDIKRIRLGSLEAGIITPDFLKRAAAQQKLCPHFHLSLQSGCNATLKRMNRRYTAEEYYEKVLMLREYYDRPAITTDIIAGFPGETDEEFEGSYEFVKKVGFYETHIFPYSKREGTRAAKMTGQVSAEVKKSRTDRLIRLGNIQKEKYLEGGRGSEAEVLFEDKEEHCGKLLWSGYTERYEKVLYESDEDLTNKLVKVRL